MANATARNQERGCEGTALSNRLRAAGYGVRSVGIIGDGKVVE
jgi:hypothetical protein